MTLALRPTFRCAILCLALALAGSVCSPLRADSVTELINRLAAREQALSTLAAKVTRESYYGSDWAAYQQARQAHRSAVQRFLGRPPAARADSAVAEDALRTRDVYQVQWNAEKGARLITVLAPINLGTRSMYFDGGVWQTHYHHADANMDVVIDTSIQEPEVLQALGLAGSVLWLSGSSFVPARQTSLPLTHYLRELHDAELVTIVELDAGANDVIVIDYVEPTTQVAVGMPVEGQTGPPDANSGPPVVVPADAVATPSPAEQVKRNVCHRVRLTLDASRGLMPRLAEGTTVCRNDAGGWSEVKPPQRWTVEWLDPINVGENLWLPQRARARYDAGVILPEGNDFDRAVDGPVDGPPLPDLDRTRAVMFNTGRTEFRITEVSANGAIPDPLFRSTFPAGTRVQDNRTGEVYELTAVGPAVDAELKKVLDVLPPPASPRRRFGLAWLIAVSAILLTGVAAYLLVSRRRRRKGS